MIRHSERRPDDSTPRLSHPHFQGIWKDEHGSMMVLTQRQNSIQGHYETAFKQDGELEQFELRGFVNNDLICFIVDFGKHESLASWVGQLTTDEFDEEVIRTAWLLSQNLIDPSNPNSIKGAALSGTNELRRIDG